jgi:hypothetical protein
MGSGIIQLASYGIQDMYFIDNPTITFFKVMYKRHTNFAIESIPQYFNIKPDFGTRVSCNIAKIGDLIGKIYLLINLPPIGKFIDIPNETGSGNSNIATCAWCSNIGYQLIKQIDLEIGGSIIDRHYADWFNIWYEITVPLSKRDGLNKMIGNIDILTGYTSSKQGYLLYIPLIFWFNRFPNLAFPLISAYNTDIKINVEFNSLNNCLILGPTHYITIKENICLFNKGDIIYQVVNNLVYYMKFIFFDINNSRLYYIKITPEILNQTNLIYSSLNMSYFVTPTSSDFLYLNQYKYFPQTINLPLGQSYLLVDYIFLDSPERLKFAKNKHDYLIELLTFDNDKVLYQTNNKIKINYTLLCKELFFRCNYDYIQNGYILDTFNYTNSILKSGTNIINSILILMNGQQRLSQQNSDYFNLIQPYMYHTNQPKTGLNIYSFSIKPEEFQPSGYCNLSKIEDIEIDIVIDKNVSYVRPINFRVYGTILNILKFSNGLCKLEFS